MRHPSIHDIPVMPMPEWVRFRDLSAQLEAAILIHDFLGRIPPFLLFEIFSAKDMKDLSASVSDEPEQLMVLTQSRRSRQVVTQAVATLQKRNPRHAQVEHSTGWDFPRAHSLHQVFDKMREAHTTIQSITLLARSEEDWVEIHLLRTPFVISEFKRQIDRLLMLERDVAI